MHQHASAYVSIRRSIRQHTSYDLINKKKKKKKTEKKDLIRAGEALGGREKLFGFRKLVLDLAAGFVVL